MSSAASDARGGLSSIGIPKPGQEGFYVIFDPVWVIAAALHTLATSFSELVMNIIPAYRDSDGRRHAPQIVARNVVRDKTAMTGLTLDGDAVFGWYCHAPVQICVPLSHINKRVGQIQQQNQCIWWTTTDDPDGILVADRVDDTDMWNGIAYFRLRSMDTVDEDTYYAEVPPALSTLVHARCSTKFLAEIFQNPRKVDADMDRVQVTVLPGEGPTTPQEGGVGAPNIEGVNPGRQTTTTTTPTVMAFQMASAMLSTTYVLVHGIRCSSDYVATVVVPENSVYRADHRIMARYPLPTTTLFTKTAPQLAHVADLMLLLYPGSDQPQMAILYTIGQGGHNKRPWGSLDILISPEVPDADADAEMEAAAAQLSSMVSTTGPVMRHTISGGDVVAQTTSGTAAANELASANDDIQQGDREDDNATSGRPKRRRNGNLPRDDRSTEVDELDADDDDGSGGVRG